MHRGRVLVAIALVATAVTACNGSDTNDDEGGPVSSFSADTGDADATRALDQYLVEFCGSAGPPWCASYIGVTVQGDTATAEIASGSTFETAQSLCFAIGGALFSNTPVADASIVRVVAPDGQTLVQRDSFTGGRCE